MQWITPELFQQAIYIVFGFTLFMFTCLMFVDAPYGRRDEDTHWLWGPNIPTRIGWFLLEAPVFFAFGIFFFLGDNWLAPAPLILFLLFEGHYFHRTFIYPRSLKPKPGAGFRVGILLNGMPLNAFNGFINGWYISQYGQHLYSISWLYDPRFIIGIMVFFAGFTLAKKSDHILANLRKPGETDYKIPYGGAYRWVSNPHYLGELLQWTGFAIACWSIPALAFVCITLSNLLPRALSNHRWYLEKFADYPKERKALIPFII
jgi:protein-S-isoprenylcysteine O-methyltransferase Ste14